MSIKLFDTTLRTDPTRGCKPDDGGQDPDSPELDALAFTT